MQPVGTVVHAPTVNVYDEPSSFAVCAISVGAFTDVGGSHLDLKMSVTVRVLPSIFVPSGYLAVTVKVKVPSA